MVTAAKGILVPNENVGCQLLVANCWLPTVGCQPL
jgi:hypothetical protein